MNKFKLTERYVVSVPFKRKDKDGNVVLSGRNYRSSVAIPNGVPMFNIDTNKNDVLYLTDQSDSIWLSEQPFKDRNKDEWPAPMSIHIEGGILEVDPERQAGLLKLMRISNELGQTYNEVKDEETRAAKGQLTLRKAKVIGRIGIMSYDELEALMTTMGLEGLGLGKSRVDDNKMEIINQINDESLPFDKLERILEEDKHVIRGSILRRMIQNKVLFDNDTREIYFKPVANRQDRELVLGWTEGEDKVIALQRFLQDPKNQKWYDKICFTL